MVRWFSICTSHFPAGQQPRGAVQDTCRRGRPSQPDCIGLKFNTNYYPGWLRRYYKFFDKNCQINIPQKFLFHGIWCNRYLAILNKKIHNLSVPEKHTLLSFPVLRTNLCILTISFFYHTGCKRPVQYWGCLFQPDALQAVDAFPNGTKCKSQMQRRPNNKLLLLRIPQWFQAAIPTVPLHNCQNAEQTGTVF